MPMMIEEYPPAYPSHHGAMPPHKICKEIAPCRHAGLFVGKAILKEYWPRIVRWIVG